MSILDTRSPWVQFDFLDENSIKNMLIGVMDDENRLKETYDLYHKIHSLFHSLDSNPISTLSALIPIVTTNLSMFTEAEIISNSFFDRIRNIVNKVIEMKNLEDRKSIEDAEVIEEKNGDSSESS